MKRAIDVLIAGLALFVLLPVWACVAIIVWASMGRPILFRQVRPGRYGKPFELVKFRTMQDACDRNGLPLPDDARLTGLGKSLRATSLDELPQLWNVLRGDMSLVGPRPLLMRYLERYSPDQARRHDVKPGITGWAQVNGRNALTWEKKFALDLWYVENRSLRLDLLILSMTLAKVVRRHDISAANVVTMPEFMGSDTDMSTPHKG